MLVKINRIVTALSTGVVSLFTGGVALAQTLPERPFDPVALMERVINYVSVLIFTGAVIAILWAAYLYLTGGGSEDKQTQAKNVLLYAVVAIVVVVFARGIVTFFKNFF